MSHGYSNIFLLISVSIYMLHLFFDLWWFSYIQLFALMLQNHEVVAWIFDSNHHLLSVLLTMKSFGACPSVGDDGWFVNYGPETMVCQLCFGNSTWFGDYGAWFGNCPGICFWNYGYLFWRVNWSMWICMYLPDGGGNIDALVDQCEYACICQTGWQFWCAIWSMNMLLCVKAYVSKRPFHV